MINRISDFMAWLGGGDTELLAEMPRERARFVQMAGVLLTTASIAALSMIFALHDGVAVPLILAILLGLFWGVIILNIDRFLVLSMGSTRSRWTLALMALPRLALAVVLSLVISTPLVLRIFASDINAQLYTMRLERSAQQAQLESHSKEQQQLDAVRAQISADNAILAGHIPPPTSPQLQTAQASVTRLQPLAQSDFQTANRAYEAWQCELSGQNCAGSSGHPGDGPRAQAKQQAYDEAQATYTAVEGQLKHAQSAQQSAQAEVTAETPQIVAGDKTQALQALPGLEQKRTQLQAFIQGESTYGSQVNQADTGILAQLQALSQASAQSPGLNAARLAVLALFFIIEILPVTVKILLNLMPPSAYEQVAMLRDEEATDAARTRRAEKRRIAEEKSRTRISVETDMRAREKDLGRHANEHVAAEMTRILDVALQDWSRQVQDTLPTVGDHVNGSTPSANGSGLSPNGSAPPDTQISPGFGLPDGGNL